MKTVMRWISAGALACCVMSSSLAAEKLIFQLDWLPGGDKAGIYAALKQGYFAAEGLDVSIRTGRGSSDSVTKIATGAADVGVAGIAALMMMAAEGAVPVKAVMSIYSKPPDAIFVTKGSGITSLKSLSGKTVATSPFSSSNALWPVLLQSNGIDPASVKLIKAEPATMAPMLAQGNVDATIAWGTVAAGYDRILKQAGKEAVMLPWSNFGLDGYGWSVVASDKMIREKPEVVKGVVRALAKGFEFAINNPDAAAADLKATVPEADAKELAAEFRSSIPMIKNEISTAKGFGTFDPKLLRSTWVWVAKSMNYPENKVDPEKLVDRTFVK